MLAIAPGISAHVRPGWVAIDGVSVAGSSPALEGPMAAAAASMRGAADQPELTGWVRAMYRRFGIDPTKTRPSSEALLRRVRKGDPLPRLNTAVDVCNWCSLEFQVPYGLYDLAHIDGSIELRAGLPGESYAGIRKDDVHLEGRLVLADARGPFGNPTSDSARTMVTPATTAILTVIFAPSPLSPAALQHMLDVTSTRMREFAGGIERSRGIAPV